MYHKHRGKNKPSSKSHIIHTNQIHIHCRSNVKGNMIKDFFNGRISSESQLAEVVLYGHKKGLTKTLNKRRGKLGYIKNFYSKMVS